MSDILGPNINAFINNDFGKKINVNVIAVKTVATFTKYILLNIS